MDNQVLNLKTNQRGSKLGVESALKLASSASHFGKGPPTNSDKQETTSLNILRKSALRGFNAVGVDSSRNNIEATTMNSGSQLSA